MSSKKLCCAVLGVVAGFSGIPCQAFAAPGVSVSADGDCPSQQQLEEALVARGLQLSDSEYTVTSHAAPDDHIVMQLVRHAGETLLTRRFASEDCRAVADAAAVVVEAYFIQVSSGNSAAAQVGTGLSELASAAPRESPSASAPVTAGTPRERLTDALPHVEPGSVVPAGGVVSGPRTLGRPFIVVPRESHWEPKPLGHVGIGVAISLPEDAFTSQMEAGAGLEWNQVPLSVEIDLATSWPDVSGVAPARVRRWANQGVLRVGTAFGRHPRYRPWIGFGGTIAQLRALDVNSAPTKSSTSAVFGAGVEVVWPIAGAWSGRLDLSCLLLASRDSYRVDPDGEIGRGPRVACAALIGTEIGAVATKR